MSLRTESFFKYSPRSSLDSAFTPSIKAWLSKRISTFVALASSAFCNSSRKTLSCEKPKLARRCDDSVLAIYQQILLNIGKEPEKDASDSGWTI
jgi:hypothetical protein